MSLSINDSSHQQTLLKMQSGEMTGGVDPFAGERLVWAAAKGNVDVVMELHKSQGADIRQRGRHSRTALIEAAYYGHLPVVKYLLSVRADVNEVDEWGRTPLMHAASQGHLEVSKLLLSVPGIDSNARDGMKGNTAIMLAAKAGHGSVVELLVRTVGLKYTYKEMVDGGVSDDVDRILKDNATSIVLLDACDRQLYSVIEDIIDRRAPTRDQLTAALKDDPKVAQILIKAGADLNGAFDSVSPEPVRSPILEPRAVPIILAAAAGHDKLIRTLWESGAEIDTVALLPRVALPQGSEDTLNTCTALSIAVMLGKVECVETLLAAGASLDIRHLRRPPGSLLIDAVKSGIPKLLDLLLEQGCLSDNAIDIGGMKAVDHARLLANEGRSEGVEMLKLLAAVGGTKEP
ncbi:hypothetical protein FOL47_001384 [Perkinsus chesapeaki]|uniref:Ankyrin Repeat Protein n=1 Tax=Perkinsus chesapeaki TaxID=330153 RepID=A0A7J6MJP2_PERCH|nr:hypothetical protein FOL47_001384 [Perkinsus chesapeaki]